MQQPSSKLEPKSNWSNPNKKHEHLQQNNIGLEPCQLKQKHYQIHGLLVVFPIDDGAHVKVSQAGIL